MSPGSRDAASLPVVTGDSDNRYHRRGEPGGPGAEVLALPIELAGTNGQRVPAYLLDAQGHASEDELLRTICHTLGINWGQDDLGWWAAVPQSLRTGLDAES